MDTRTPTGKAMLQMMCVITELERNLIAERVKEGLEASKKRGKRLGRLKLEKEKLSIALRMYVSKEYSIKEIVEGTGISQCSLYRAIKENLKKHRDDKSPCFYFVVYDSNPVTTPIMLISCMYQTEGGYKL